MSYRRLSRRKMLRGVAGVGVALPFLEAMKPGVSQAQAGGPKRFGVFFSSCGVAGGGSRASGEGPDYSLGRELSPLEDHRGDLVFFNGVDAKTSYDQSGNPHSLSMSHMLTAAEVQVNKTGRAGHFIDGRVGGPSIDQAIATHIGGETKLRSLELGVESTTTPLEPFVLRMSYAGPGDPRTPLDDPQQVFTRLFGEGAQGEAMVGELLNKRKSVLDTVRQEFAAVGPTLGYDDRMRLERHAGHIRDLENSAGLVARPSASALCGMPKRPTRTVRVGNEVREEPLTADLVDCIINDHSAKMKSRCLASFADIGKAQMDLMILALACDLSRVVSLQWSTAESTVHHSHADVTLEHHRMSHDVNNFNDELKKVDNWFAKQFAYMVGQLKGINEGENSLLDNMLLFWPNEMSEGTAHSRKNLPFVTAGSLGGQLETGRCLNYSGEPHNKLYASFMNLFGKPTDSFGGNYSGTLSGFV